MKKKISKSPISKVIALAFSLTGSLAFADPFSVTWTDTVGPGSSDPPYSIGEEFSVTFVLDNGGTSALSQTWDAADIVSVTIVINNGPGTITTVLNPNGTDGPDTTSGSFVTNGAGVLTAAPSDWSDDDSPIVSTNDPSGNSIIFWDVNGGNPAYSNESTPNAAVAVLPTNVSDNTDPASWSNPGSGEPPRPPSDASPVPTMSMYGLALSMVGLLLIAARRLRSSAKRD